MGINLYIFLTIELIVVAFYDWKNRKISNLWSLFNLTLYPLMLYFFSDVYSFNYTTFIFPLFLLFLGFGLFYIQIMGAGDAKFLCTFYLLIPDKFHEEFSYFLILGILITTLPMIVYKTGKIIIENGFVFKFDHFFSLYNKKINKIPFAPIILGSWLCWALKKIY